MTLAGCKSTEVTAPNAGALKYAQQLRATVSEVVTDNERKGQMLAQIDHLDAAESTFNRDVTAFVSAFRELNASYDAPRTAFEDLFMKFESQRIASREQVLDAHFRLHELARPDEWKKIKKIEKKMYEEMLKPRSQLETAT